MVLNQRNIGKYESRQLALGGVVSRVPDPNKLAKLLGVQLIEPVLHVPQSAQQVKACLGQVEA